MGKYDGPSFYKKDHPKVKPIKKKTCDQKYKESMPKSVRTRADIKKNATEYMETPSGHASVRKKTFRRQHIPASLQHLEGWQRTKRNDQLVIKIKERLAKTEDSYLLFADHMIEKEEPEPKKETSKQWSEKTVSQTKANAGLHRSLSNIIEEDQEAVLNGKNKLDSLFYKD